MHPIPTRRTANLAAALLIFTLADANRSRLPSDLIYSNMKQHRRNEDNQPFLRPTMPSLFFFLLLLLLLLLMFPSILYHLDTIPNHHRDPPWPFNMQPRWLPPDEVLGWRNVTMPECQQAAEARSQMSSVKKTRPKAPNDLKWCFFFFRPESEKKIMAGYNLPQNSGSW